MQYLLTRFLFVLFKACDRAIGRATRRALVLGRRLLADAAAPVTHLPTKLETVPQRKSRSARVPTKHALLRACDLRRWGPGVSMPESTEPQVAAGVASTSSIRRRRSLPKATTTSHQALSVIVQLKYSRNSIAGSSELNSNLVQFTIIAIFRDAVGGNCLHA